MHFDKIAHEQHSLKSWVLHKNRDTYINGNIC